MWLKVDSTCNMQFCAGKAAAVCQDNPVGQITSCVLQQYLRGQCMLSIVM